MPSNKYIYIKIDWNRLGIQMRYLAYTFRDYWMQFEWMELCGDKCVHHAIQYAYKVRLSGMIELRLVVCVWNHRHQPQHQQQLQHRHSVCNNINSLCSFTEKKKRNSFDACAAQRKVKILWQHLLLDFTEILRFMGEYGAAVLKWISMKLMSYTRARSHTCSIVTEAPTIFLLRSRQNKSKKFKTRRNGRETAQNGRPLTWKREGEPFVNETGLFILIYAHKWTQSHPYPDSHVR